MPLSCKSRFCPTYRKKETDQWITTPSAVLPHTTWQHISFTMPRELWALFQENHVLLGPHSALAAATVKQAARLVIAPELGRYHWQLAALKLIVV